MFSADADIGLFQVETSPAARPLKSPVITPEGGNQGL